MVAARTTVSATTDPDLSITHRATGTDPHIAYTLYEPAAPTSDLTLCFLHGAAHDERCWQHRWTPYLAQQGYRCLTLSYRGHATSTWSQPIQQARLDGYAADVATVLAAEGLDSSQVLLVGHSLGGGVAQRFAARREVAGLVIVASMAFGVWAQALWREMPFQFFRRPLVFLKMLHDPGVLFQTPALAREYLFGPHAPDGLVQHYLHAGWCHESGKALLEMMQARPQSLRARHTLLLAGRQDASVPTRWMRESAARLHAPLVEEEGPHDLMLAGDCQGAAAAVWAFAQQISVQEQLP